MKNLLTKTLLILLLLSVTIASGAQVGFPLSLAKKEAMIRGLTKATVMAREVAKVAKTIAEAKKIVATVAEAKKIIAIANRPADIAAVVHTMIVLLGLTVAANATIVLVALLVNILLW